MKKVFFPVILMALVFSASTFADSQGDFEKRVKMAAKASFGVVVSTHILGKMAIKHKRPFLARNAFALKKEAGKILFIAKAILKTKRPEVRKALVKKGIHIYYTSYKKAVYRLAVNWKIIHKTVKDVRLKRVAHMVKNRVLALHKIANVK